MLFLLLLVHGRASAEVIPRNITVLITVEPRLTLSVGKEDAEKELKSPIEPKGKNYTRQAENNTVLYTVTE